MKEKIKKRKLILDFNGKILNLKAYQESLRDFPSFSKKCIDETGTPYLADCIERETDCGCKIVGNGTLSFPLMIKKCDKHQN